MLLLMFLGACSLAGMAAAVASSGDAPAWLGVGALAVAVGSILAGQAERLPAWVSWPIAIAGGAVGALSLEGAELVLYLGLGGVLLVVVDRFATLSSGLSGYCVPRGGAGHRGPKATPLTDPVAREFAHVRREGKSLAVASISVPGSRQVSRRLARVARELLAELRRTDVIVRAVNERLVVVLPGGDHQVATAVLRRCLGEEHAGVLVGIATFPQDGPTFAALRLAAQSREQPWPGAGEPPDERPAAERVRSRPEAGPDQGAEERPAVLLEFEPGVVSLRRLADLIVLALAAAFVVPLIALLAMVVKLDSPGPAFVRIGRVGRDGRHFELLKLRSMTKDADRQKEALRHLNILPWPDFKLADDPRITRAGRWLRRYSLDELPQLYNVLRGDMTLVGPRPCSVKLSDYRPWQSERLDVTPGLAGRWQADARGSADFAGRCRLDIRQAKTGSLRVSVMLLIATLRSVLSTKGAL